MPKQTNDIRLSFTGKDQSMEAADKNDKKQIFKAPVSIFDAIRLWKPESEKHLKQENKALNCSVQQEEKPKKEYTFPFEIF